jgi:hypothetical protein
MIPGNQAWQLALAQPQKQAFYAVEIPDFAIVIASFTASALASAISVPGSVPVSSGGGYGVTLYGVGGYGM